jgi:hypothetical protein
VRQDLDRIDVAAGGDVPGDRGKAVLGGIDEKDLGAGRGDLGGGRARAPTLWRGKTKNPP